MKYSCALRCLISVLSEVKKWAEEGRWDCDRIYRSHLIRFWLTSRTRFNTAGLKCSHVLSSIPRNTSYINMCVVLTNIYIFQTNNFQNILLISRNYFAPRAKKLQNIQKLGNNQNLQKKTIKSVKHSIKYIIQINNPI